MKKQRVKIVYKQACYVDLFDEPFELNDAERIAWLALERELLEQCGLPDMMETGKQDSEARGKS